MRSNGQLIPPTTVLIDYLSLIPLPVRLKYFGTEGAMGILERDLKASMHFGTPWISQLTTGAVFVMSIADKREQKEKAGRHPCSRSRSTNYAFRPIPSFGALSRCL